MKRKAPLKAIKSRKLPVAAPVETILVLRTCNADMTSHSGFVWPRSGPVECPDWRNTPECGRGLHGFARGLGDGSLASWEADAIWLVVEVALADVIDLSGKVKFPRGVVLYAGAREEATRLIAERHPGGAIIGYTATAGHLGTATAGESGTATAGFNGTATAGHLGTATAGFNGTATAGESGTATAGDGGTATAGYAGTATAGDGGTATAGESGTATAGDGGTATAGDGGTATAGESGTLVLRRFDGKRYRLAVAYVGEDGVKANTPYRLDDSGKFVEVNA